MPTGISSAISDTSHPLRGLRNNTTISEIKAASATTPIKIGPVWMVSVSSPVRQPHRPNLVPSAARAK